MCLGGDGQRLISCWTPAATSSPNRNVIVVGTTIISNLVTDKRWVFKGSAVYEFFERNGVNFSLSVESNTYIDWTNWLFLLLATLSGEIGTRWQERRAVSEPILRSDWLRRFRKIDDRVPPRTRSASFRLFPRLCFQGSVRMLLHVFISCFRLWLLVCVCVEIARLNCRSKKPLIQTLQGF